MAIISYSVPDKDTKDVELMEAISAYCKKHHINRSAIIVSLLKEWASTKGITHEQARQ